MQPRGRGTFYLRMRIQSVEFGLYAYFDNVSSEKHF